MLHNTSTLYGHKLAASDGAIGHINDFYFDDKIWVIRYLVADTGAWLTGRMVLLTPHAFGKLDEYEKTLQIRLHKKQIQNSPSIEQHKPVSRQYEVEYYRYYGWPAYWNGSAMWGLNGYPVALPPTKDEIEAHHSHLRRRDDEHLQSTQAVTGYHIQTGDGTIGHVSGFLVDEKSWAIAELVVETGNWYSNKEILIPTGKIERISYEESKVYVNFSRADLERTAENDIVKAHV